MLSVEILNFYRLPDDADGGGVGTTLWVKRCPPHPHSSFSLEQRFSTQAGHENYRGKVEWSMEMLKKQNQKWRKNTPPAHALSSGVLIHLVWGIFLESSIFKSTQGDSHLQLQCRTKTRGGKISFPERWDGGPTMRFGSALLVVGWPIQSEAPPNPGKPA